MIVFKLLRVFAHLFIGLSTCAVVFPLANRAGRERCIKKWSIKLLNICGVQVEVMHTTSAPPTQCALIIANHVSWLDIFVMNSFHPCRFVAKSEIRDWPLLGWLCAKSGAIFIARGRIRDVRRIFEGLVASIKAGEHVAFFPEGTTAAQGGLLPFHSNLFEAAIDADVPIQPFAIRYVDAGGRLHSVVDFIGDMSFAQSMIAILKVGGIKAILTRLPIIETKGSHRRELAGAARQAIAAGLGHIEGN
ncbi:MAG TPA: lysophospholipid acyltransferase family protein [Burkholderiaceae bacterium]|jgi:1-acyl-sn-glycerol-3-phosphate acyltransferase